MIHALQLLNVVSTISNMCLYYILAWEWIDLKLDVLRCLVRFLRMEIFIQMIRRHLRNLGFKFQLKVLDQITLENKFCLNFKIRSDFI